MYSRQIIFEQGTVIDIKLNKLEYILQDDKKTVAFNGNFSCPDVVRFETTAEAQAFIDGLLFLRNYIETYKEN